MNKAIEILEKRRVNGWLEKYDKEVRWMRSMRSGGQD
jgi:hypothetical protein